MAALQWVAVGLVLVFLDVIQGAWDLLPDPLGWLLVLLGLWQARVALPGSLLPAAALCLVVSVVVSLPGVSGVEPAVGWALSLPQVVFSVLLALALADLVPSRARGARAAAWALGVVGALPVLVVGGGLDAGLGTLAFAAVAVQVWLVYLVFSCSTELPSEPTSASR